MKNFILIAAFLVMMLGACLFVVFVMAAVGNTTERVVIDQVEITPVPTPDPIEEAKRLYVDGCDYDGRNTEYCNCTFNYMVDKWGLQSVYEMSEEYQDTDEYPVKLLEAVDNCVYLFNY